MMGTLVVKELNEAHFQGFVRYYYTVTIKSIFFLVSRSSLCSRLFRTSYFKLPEPNIEVKIFEKYEPLKKEKVNKRCQAISQLRLSVTLKSGQKYKDGKQSKLLHSLEHFVYTV